MTKNPQTIGYIVLWRVPDLDVSYDILVQIAEDSGVDRRFVPKPPNPRNAWEKATNLGAKGILIEPPAYVVAQVKADYGVEPKVRLTHRVIKDSAPMLVRHIVREVVIPVSDSSGSRSMAERQLGWETVAVLSYDVEGKRAVAEASYELGDTQGYVNGNLSEEIGKIKDRVNRLMNRADGEMVRFGVREALLKAGATLMNSGGAYFIPNFTGAFDDLKNLKIYCEQLAPYATTDSKPQLTILPLLESGELQEARFDIAQNAVEQFTGQLTRLMEDLAPVMAAGRTEKVSDNIRNRVKGQFDDLTVNLARYRTVLNDNLSQLDNILSQAQAAIDTAMGVTVYRKGRRALGEAGEIEIAEGERGQRSSDTAEVEPTTARRKARG